MPPTLHIGLLGGFLATRGEETIEPLETPRLRSLLAYLVLHRRGPQPRERLAFLFWPDTTEAQARTNLRRELHHLRRALPAADEYLHVTRQTLHWRARAPCRIDVAEFEAAVVSAGAAEEEGDGRRLRKHLERAGELYAGDLLPSCYDAWIDAPRNRLRRTHEQVLDRLVSACEAEGDLRSAILHAERLIAHDPLREASHARLIALHAAGGDRAAAVRAYEACEATLGRELGIEPGPATKEARKRAATAGRRAGSGPAPARSSGELAQARPQPDGTHEAAPIVGRRRELEALRSWVREAPREVGDGTAPTLLVLGEPGIGKTRLLDELVRILRDAGGRTIRGRGFEAETVRPYGAWIDALGSVPRAWLSDSEELGSLIPDFGGGAPPPEDRNRLFDAVARWLAGLANDVGPVAVLIDDIQWVDEASAALLHYVTRVLAESPVLVACAGRPGELDARIPVSGLVRSLERGGRARTLRLGPLGREDILALARLHGDDVGGDRIVADSGGNPLFVLELVRAAGGGDAGSGVSVEELIRGRLARLDEPAREVLSWAAALGRSFDPSTLASLVGQPPLKFLPALDQLEHHGILRPGDATGGSGATYDFGHDIVRRTAYDMLSEPRRRLVHLHIARTLSEVDDPEGTMAGDVAHHAALGGDAALAARASVTAGERCLRVFAYAEATELARRGIEHARTLDGPERVRLHMALLRVAVGTRTPPGRAAELDEELRALIAEARSLGLVAEEAIGYGLLSILNYEHEDFGRVHETSVRAADTLQDGEVDPLSDPAVAARTLSQAGACLASIERDMPRAEELLRKAESLAERARVELIDISLGLGAVHRFAGDHEEAVSHLERGIRMGRSKRDHFRASECLSFLIMLELDAGAPGLALARCRELEPVAAKLKGGSEAPFARALDAAARYELAEREAPRDPAEREAPGDLADALDALRQLDASRKLAYILTVAARTDLSADRPELARQRTEEAVRLARVVDHRSGLARAGALRVRSLLVLEELARAEEALEALRQELGGTDGLSARARAALAGLETHPSLVS